MGAWGLALTTSLEGVRSGFVVPWRFACLLVLRPNSFNSTCGRGLRGSQVGQRGTAPQQRRAELTAAFASHGSPDTSLVVFGAVAREEVTSGSHLDWILLIDGQSVPEHKEQERETMGGHQSPVC